MKKIAVILVNLIFLALLLGCTKKNDEKPALFNEWVTKNSMNNTLTLDLRSAHFGDNAEFYITILNNADGNKMKAKVTAHIYHESNNTNNAIVVLLKQEVIEGQIQNNPMPPMMMTPQLSLHFTVDNDKLILKVFENLKNIQIKDYETYLKNKADFPLAPFSDSNLTFNKK